MTEIQSKYVLIVDDNADAREILTKVLSTAGYSVLIAVDGAQAAAMLSDFTPDAIILDLMMPRMSGFELLTRLHNNPRTRAVPVIVMSAYLSAGEDHILKLPGVTRIMPKAGFRIPDLLKTVGELAPLTRYKEVA
jgi:CheY-like chemotaxis protein